MVKTKSKAYLKYIRINWIIPLSSTMIGVVLGLYLNNYNEKKSLIEHKEKAMIQVSIELMENQNLLNTYHHLINQKYTELKYLFSKINSDTEIIIAKDSIEAFKIRSKNIFKIDYFVAVNNNYVNISGDLNLYIESPLVMASLSNITWESYKQTNYLSITKFDCLRNVENIYEIQNEVNELNIKWRKILFNDDYMQDPSTKNNFMKTWKALLLKQKILMELYDLKEDLLNECK